MRVTRRAIDTEALPWEALSDVLQRKVLNGDPESGPHTMLLRSGPREPGPAFAQYHPVDEELLGLDGDFTFDGSTWFGRGSYAFYPAFFVHGANVHVRGGYMVYLRLSGVSELFTVDEAASEIPYYVGEGQAGDTAMQLADALALPAVTSADAASPFRLQPLHQSAVSGGGSTLLIAPSAAVGDSVALETTGLLELFALSGRFLLSDGSTLQAHSYHCEVGEHLRLSLVCAEPGTLMISHDGILLR